MPARAAHGTPRVVIIGGGFAGYQAANVLRRVRPRIDIVLINPTDYFLYLPILPEVAAGLIEPRRVCVSLRRWPEQVRLELGTADRIDVRRQRVSWLDPEGRRDEVGYDRLLVTVGSVNKLLPIPGVAENAHAFRGIGEALYLRDHMIRQMELAAGTSDEQERASRSTFVVVGAGYTGTELAAQGQLLTERVRRASPVRAGEPARWLLLDTAARVLPELDRRLSDAAAKVLSRRGVEVRTGQSVAHARADCVELTTGEVIATRSLFWCVGVRPDPIVEGLALPTVHGRLVVDEFLEVPEAPSVFACGDCAAVPDATRPGEYTGMTAQHAQRQGPIAARNIAASLGRGTMQRYRHRDLGFLVDLGGTKAAANPLHVPLAGIPAKIVTRGYHLLAMPGNRRRIAMDWAANLAGAPPPVQLGLARPAHGAPVSEAVEPARPA